MKTLANAGMQKHNGPWPKPPLQRFWKLVRKNGPYPFKHRRRGRCWLWIGATSKGYGRFFLPDGRVIQAHHFLWTRKHGAIPRGKELDHLCRHRRCVRDSHVEPVTRRINLLRGATIVAAQAAKTVCINGHALTKANIYLWRGHRLCRTCRRIRNRDAARRCRGQN